SLNQSKSALRHIENHLEAVSGSGVVLDTLMTTEKTSVRGSRKASRKGNYSYLQLSIILRSRNPEKSSRSPLRTSTQDNSNVCVCFFREVYPPPSPPVAHCVSAPSASLSELVYERDSRPEQTADLDSTRSSALDNTTIRFLNDPPVPGSAGAEVRAAGLQADGQTGAPAGSVSSSPGSASVRLEKLRQRQTDGKLEKLKERIRKQREQLEESAERERILGRLEQPVGIGASLGTTVPTAKVRKVAPAPPAPIYKGFNTSETTIRTADGRVWGEEEFHNYSREIYTHHLTDGVKQKPKEKEKKVVERKPVKPVRKIHRSASVPDPQTRPVISTSSWREGQKLVKMILGPSPRLPGEPRAQSAERERRTGASSRSSSDPRLELNRRSRPNSTERQTAKISRPAGAGGDRGRSPSTDRLSADIQGILDDLQLEGGAEVHEEGSPSRRSAGRRAQAPIRSSRSVSPAKPHPDKKRQYDAEAVRQYIARQQEDRKRRQAEERRNQKEAEHKRSQRLQELYRRQREGVAKPQAPPTNSTRSCLQDTYTKLLLEHRLQQVHTLTHTQSHTHTHKHRPTPNQFSIVWPNFLYLSRAELGVGSLPSAASLVPSTGQLFSQLLAMEGAAAISQPVDLSATHTIRAHPSRTAHASRLSRVEALKASAVSLSSRIESEALKLAGGGVNYGVDCSRNVGTGLPPVIPQDDEANLINSLSPPVRECPGGAEEPAQRIQRLLSAGQSAFGTDPAELPGVGNLYGFGSAERREYTAKPRPSPPNPAPLFPERAEHLDSSGGSISEGLLTESDPTDVLLDLPKPSLKLSGADYCASLQNGPTYDPITRFQREAEQHSPYRPAAALQDSRPAWGDLAKGSPNSVINIFTKNLQNYSRGRFHCTDIIYMHVQSIGRSERSQERPPVDGQRSASRPVSELQWNGVKQSPSPNGSPRGSQRSADTGSTAGAVPDRVYCVYLPAAVELQFAPGVLQQRLSAELSYIDSVEESVRQLGDVERVRAVSLAQQETVALAQILKAQQQRQERELQLLRLKAEQEALETQRQLQESRERAAQAHTEMCVNLVQSQQQVLLGIQESSSRIINQQTETAQHTAATARHIREMTELARSQMLNVPIVTPFYDQQKEPQPQTDSSRSEVPPDSGQSPSAETPPDSLSESIPSRRPTISGGGSSPRQSPSLSSSVKEVGEDGGGGVERSSSVEEEIHTAVEESLHTDSVQSLLEDRGDSASVATEYSLKFEESVTEDELEKSFRSLLPSESHWRDSVERNRSPLPESDEERSRAKSSPQLSNKQDSSMPFSSGQDSFNKFTMTMVKQYMQEEEVRAQHQSSLLRLRHRALKEKTKAELAWLEHQKRRLRDKGEDDKMPPIRKKQRGLLLKLQQEQAEIRRLQEANKAARRERQLLLKQQEEIEKIRQSTLRLREKLRTAGDQSPVKEAEPSLATDAETRSPSPLSVSGSETSSIMQKLKKMRSHMDERFLTEREQRLVRRRLQAEELLQWRQRLDAEEAAVRRMEKQALAAWEQHPQCKHSAQLAQDSIQSPSSTTYLQERSAEAVSEGDSSPGSSARSAGWVSEQLVSPSSDSPTSKLPSAHTSGSPHTHTNSAQPSHSKLCEPSLLYRTEAASDQSDIEGRVLALKEELRRRKTEVQRLKKVQKQRNKERLKAQEASLLKQLESYNNFIEKTKAELSKEADHTPTAKPQIKTPASGTEKPSIRSPALHRSVHTLPIHSTSEYTGNCPEPPEPIENHEVNSSDEDPPTVTPTPVFGSPERVGSSLESPEPQPTKTQSSTKPQPDVSADESVVSSQRSDVIEELDYLKSEGSGDDHDSTHSDQHSQPLLKLDIQLPSHIRAEEVNPEEKTDLTETSQREAEEEQSGEPVTTKEPEALLEKSSSPADGSYTPDFSPRKDLDEPKETQSLVQTSVDRYNDDFESSFDSSLREDRKGSEPTSPSAQQPKEQSYKSSFVSSEEEIDEELSVKSGITSDSFHPERPLDLQILAKPSKETLGDDLFDVANSPKSPTALTSRSAASSPPPRDEMPSYIVGDRVLVSNVQPGTLRFKGLTSFANGFWAGVELDKSEGSNDGNYDGVAYFQCKKGHGIFAPPDKVTPLPEKFESFVDTSEDEDSSLDDQSHKTSEKLSSEDSLQRDPLQDDKSGPQDVYSGSKESSSKPSDLEPGQDNLKLDLEDDVNFDILKNLSVPNGRSRDVILEFEDVSQGNGTLPISVQEKETSQLPEETQTADILDLLDHGKRPRVEGLQESSELLALSTLADKLLDSFMSDTLKQFQEIKKMKEKKIAAANQQKDGVLSEDEELMDSFSQFKSSSKINDFHTFFDQDQEEVSSPELCNRSESPVLGPSGQEELVKRLAELELSRELLDSLGEDQDWFDEDFGLSSRKQQEKLKQRQEEGPLSGSPPAKVPSRPQPPHPKLPEEPAMLVPHNAPEVEKLVRSALLEIWTHCGLDRGQQSLAGVQKPRPSDGFLRNGERNDEQEAEFIRSYKQAVFDLSWEVVQDIFIEDPNADQPQWVKPRRVNSSYIHRINSPNDLAKVQAFVTSEVLKLYGLKKEQNHKTDWQKMLKFGRKKRDRVDHILVQELHEEEALWVNYDEDELFVKMQLADGIFDALLKDTTEILIQIQEKRSKRSQS
uniref:Centrosomal protein 350 n=1 Tax=Astyanax mexicanus TaxID=7994 RepID=W5L5K6_ASTMX